MDQRTRRRVAITGLGVVAPCGLGKDSFWEGLFKSPAQGDMQQIEDWDPSPWFANAKEARRADRFTQLAVASAAEALEQAGQLTADPTRIGVVFGTGVGGISTIEDQIIVNHEKGARRVSPFLIPMMMPNAAAAAVSMRHGFQGSCECITTACAAGTHSIGAAIDSIRSGRNDAVVAGGAEASITPTAVAGFRNMTAMTVEGVSRPFDARRDGFVIGEGSGALVLEEWDMAVARGATILAEALGSASTADAHHITAPSPDGGGAIRSMELALSDAQLTAADIVHINAHGTSTPLNDATEAKAVAAVFGDGPIVTSTKGVTGHPLGAAGAMEAVTVALSMKHKLIPPTIGLEQVDPEMPKLDLVQDPNGREWTPGPSMSNSFGFGGHNGSLVFGPA